MASEFTWTISVGSCKKVHVYVFFSLFFLLAAFSTLQVVVNEAKTAPFFFSVRIAAAVQDRCPLSNTTGNKKDKPPIHAPLWTTGENFLQLQRPHCVRREHFFSRSVKSHGSLVAKRVSVAALRRKQAEKNVVLNKRLGHKWVFDDISAPNSVSKEEEVVKSRKAVDEAPCRPQTGSRGGRGFLLSHM